MREEDDHLCSLHRRPCEPASSCLPSDVCTTRKFCEGVMNQEQEFLRLLEGTAIHEIVGEALDLYDANNKLLARFESQYLK